MFDWLGDLIGGIGNAIGSVIGGITSTVVDSVMNLIVRALYDALYKAFGQFIANISNMGIELFGLPWVQATMLLFAYLGWALYAVGVVVAVFDIAVEYQTGRANVKSMCINVIKGFFACYLIAVLPVDLYKFCMSLQTPFFDGIVSLFSAQRTGGLGELATSALAVVSGMPFSGLFSLATMIAFCYCIVKNFFANLKRGGILIIQIAVGSLYMFSVPRGYTDGFIQWCKQVIALCLTAFLQTTLLMLGLMTFKDNTILGIGVMLSSTEVPRIAQQFGLDSSVKVNATNVIHTTTTAVNLAKTIAR